MFAKGGDGMKREGKILHVKSLIVADGVGNFSDCTMTTAEDEIQKEFPDFKLWRVKESDGTITYLNSLYISSIIFA